MRAKSTRRATVEATSPGLVSRRRAGWDGASNVSVEVPSNLFAHHVSISLATSTSITSRTITVRGRPPDSITTVDISDHVDSVTLDDDGVTLLFHGWFEAIEVSASGSFGAGTVDVVVASSNPTLASRLFGGFTGWDGTGNRSLGDPGTLQYPKHQVSLSHDGGGTAGTYTLWGLPQDGLKFVDLGETVSTANGGEVVLVRGRFSHFQWRASSAISSGSLAANIVSYDDGQGYESYHDDGGIYLLIDGSRPMAGDLDMGTNNITNVGTVDGVDVSAHATRHETGGADAVNHDLLDGFNANEHYDHTAIDITAGDGLTGGGDISATRTLTVNPTTNGGLAAGPSGVNIDLSNLATQTSISGTDTLLFRTGGIEYGITFSNLEASVDHGGLAGLGDDDHPQYAEIANTETISSVWTFSNYLVITPMTAPSHSEGRFWYDSTAKALSYYNDEADVTVNIGQEILLRARNTTGSTITNGSAVYISGSAGASLPTIALAQADALATSECIGLATHDIGNNSNGYVCVKGEVNGLDTSSFVAGAELFLSPSVAGGLTTTRPTTDFVVVVGYVTVSNISIGSIKVTMGPDAKRGDLTSESQNQTITGTWAFSTHPTGLDHTQLSNIGSNSHAAIDSHIANGPIHIDWTGTTEALSTSGTAATGALTVTGNIIVTGTVDGRDVAADGTKLDGIESGATADQSAGEIEAIVNHDNLLGFVANEHIDWTSASQSLLTSGNVTGGDGQFDNVTVTGNVDISGNIDAVGSIFITEKAAAAVDVAGFGQIWVKNDTPNALYFTDDAGTDWLLNQAGFSGPVSSTDNALTRWDGTGGDTVQDSGWTLSDADLMTAGANLDMNNNDIINVGDASTNIQANATSGSEIRRTAGTHDSFIRFWDSGGFGVIDLDAYGILTYETGTLVTTIDPNGFKISAGYPLVRNNSDGDGYSDLPTYKDLLTTTRSYQLDTTLDAIFSFEMAANETASGYIVVSWRADATPDLKVGWSAYPTGCEINWGASNSIYGTLLETSNLALAGAGTSVERITKISFVIHNGANSGTVSFGGAQNSSSFAFSYIDEGTSILVFTENN